MRDRLFVLSQYALPKQRLTRFAGRIASAPRGASTTRLIQWFVGKYGVDMALADQPDPAQYATFNDFFTRALKPGARPIADAPWVSPVDGAISQLGAIEGAQGDQILQAKGHRYSVEALLGGDAQRAAAYAHGQFCTIYLSPKDYHRIHMPCDGTLERMSYVPGALYSVNPATARGVKGLFARNERVVCHFRTPHGPMALVLVGATIVGSMATVWHGVVNPPRANAIQHVDYADGEVALAKGAEMGRFLLGSTVVMLWPQSAGLRFDAAWQPGRSVRLGETMAMQHLHTS